MNENRGGGSSREQQTSQQQQLQQQEEEEEARAQKRNRMSSDYGDGFRKGAKRRRRGGGAFGIGRNDPGEQRPQTELEKQFTQYAKVLDEGHERKERVYKASRDVTAESKKVVFLLLRITELSSHVEDSKRSKVLEQANETLQNIAEKNILPIVKELYVNLQENYYRYHPQFTFGLQEFIEAVSLYKYLSENRLVSKLELEQEFLQFENVELADGTIIEHLQLSVTMSDYVLGIADLTGELMRFATNASSIGNRTVAFEVKKFLQDLLAQFLALQHYEHRCASIRKDLCNKISIMQTSCYKVEMLCFKLTLQDKEQLFAPIHLSSLENIAKISDNNPLGEMED